MITMRSKPERKISDSKENSKVKGPVAGACLVCSGNIRNVGIRHGVRNEKRYIT